MEDEVEITVLLADAVDDCADGVGNTAEKEIYERFDRQRLEHSVSRKEYRPAHTYVAYHRELAVCFKVDRRKHRGKNSEAPNDAEYYSTTHLCI